MNWTRAWRFLQSIGFGLYLRLHRVQFDALPRVDGLWPRVRNKGTLHIGSSCYFVGDRLRTLLNVHEGAVLELGDRAFIDDGVNICAVNRVSIGSDVKIGDMTQIHDSDFDPVGRSASVRKSPIAIGDNVWIARSCILLSGVCIGDHSVVGAASVVTESIPERVLAVGSPARVIRHIDAPTESVRP